MSIRKKKHTKEKYFDFIDTNIFLDFYRVRKSKISLNHLDLIKKNNEKIIFTRQIEMEFKKTRQRVLL